MFGHRPRLWIAQCAIVVAFIVSNATAHPLAACAHLFLGSVAAPTQPGEGWLQWEIAYRIEAKANAERTFASHRVHPQSTLHPLSDAQLTFLQKALLPVLYHRAWLSLDTAGQLRSRPWKAETATLLTLEEAGQLKLRVELEVEGLSRPTIIYATDGNILRVPRQFPWDHLPPEERAGYVRRFLQGHPLHPYLVAPGDTLERERLTGLALELKEPQIHAIAAGTGSFESFLAKPSEDSGRLLVVGSTALGKTRIAQEILHHIARRSPRKLHVVTTDEIRLVRQLRDSWIVFQAEAGRGGVRLVQFDRESMQPTPSGVEAVADLAALENLIAQSTTPVILFTGTRQLREITHASSALAAAASAEETRFGRLLGSLFFDEAHLAGDPANHAFLQRWKQLPDASFFLLGVTATPAKQITESAPNTPETGLTTGDAAVTRNASNRLFTRSTFWAGLDTATEFLRNRSSEVRPAETVLRQMAEDARLGRTIDFFEGNRDAVKVLDLGVIHQNAKGDRGVYYGQIAASLRSQFERHAKGLVFAGTHINDAETLLAAARALNIPNRTFEVLHSGQSRGQQLAIVERYRRLRGDDQIHHLIVVDLLGAGFDLPELTLLVDFSRGGNEQDVIQHFGRVLRPALWKRLIEIIVAQQLNETNVGALLRVYAEMVSRGGGHGDGSTIGALVPLAGPQSPIPLGQVAFWNVQPRVDEVLQWPAAQIRARAADLNAFWVLNGRLPTLTAANVNDAEGRLAIDTQVLAIHKMFARRLGEKMDPTIATNLRAHMERMNALIRPQLERRLLDAGHRMLEQQRRYIEIRRALLAELRAAILPGVTSSRTVLTGNYENRAPLKAAFEAMEQTRRDIQILVRDYTHAPGGIFQNAGAPQVLIDLWTNYCTTPNGVFEGYDGAWNSMFFFGEYKHLMGQLRGSIREGWNLDLQN